MKWFDRDEEEESEIFNSGEIPISSTRAQVRVYDVDVSLVVFCIDRFRCGSAVLNFSV